MRQRRWLAVAAACVVAVLPMLAGAGAVAGPARADLMKPSEAWHQQVLRLPEAHKISRGDGVTVALVGDGVAAHRDLAGALLPGASFAAQAARSDEWRATPEAGLIAARGDGVSGLLGVAPGASLLPVRVGGERSSDTTGIAAGIDFAVSRGAKVIDVSYQGQDVTDEMRMAVAKAVAANVVVVAPAEFDLNFAQQVSLATLPGVVAVGPVDRSGGSGSSRSASLNVDLVAPGVKVVAPFTASLGDDYAEFDGARIAAAIVAGVAALVRAKYPDLPAADVIRRLTTTSPDGVADRTLVRGWGAVNPMAALTARLLPDLPAAAASGPTVADLSGGPAIRDYQWYLDALRVPLAQRLATGEGVKIGMVDGAVDDEHPDLRGQVVNGAWISAEGPSGPGRVHTGRQPKRDDAMVDFNDNDPYGSTACAGIMVAKGGAGALGVAPGARLLLVEQDSTAWDAPGIRWLADHGARVILLTEDNLGSGYGEKARSETIEAMKYALQRDVVVVAPALRPSASAATPPRGVVTVSALDSGGAVAPGSSGVTAALSAPGQHIVTTKSTRQDSRDASAYASVWLRPDDAAAAYVAGVAALVRQRYPRMKMADVVNRLVITVTPRSALAGRSTGSEYGRGMVDPLAAVVDGVPPVTANPLGDPGKARAAAPTGDGDREFKQILTRVGYWVIMAMAFVVSPLVVFAALVLYWFRWHRKGRRDVTSDTQRGDACAL